MSCSAQSAKTMSLKSYIRYVDAGHGGWLGWNDNLKPGAAELAKVYKAAGSPTNVRGIATNVAGWNAWTATPGEFADAPDGKYNACQDEKRYVSTFGAALKSAGFPSKAIVDTGRNAIQGLRLEVWSFSYFIVKCSSFSSGVTGATSTELVLVFVQPPILAIPTPMHSSG